MRIFEAEERREENMATLGFTILEPKRTRVIVSSTARSGINWTIHLYDTN